MTPPSDIPADAPTGRPDRAESAGPVTTADLAVGGMHCESCAQLVEEVLAEQAGVLEASVDLPGGRAHVAYDPTRLDVDQLTGAIAAAGYSATPVG